jgi:hypothetical protein
MSSSIRIDISPLFGTKYFGCWHREIYSKYLSVLSAWNVPAVIFSFSSIYDHVFWLRFVMISIFGPVNNISLRENNLSTSSCCCCFTPVLGLCVCSFSLGLCCCRPENEEFMNC